MAPRSPRAANEDRRRARVAAVAAGLIAASSVSAAAEPVHPFVPAEASGTVELWLGHQRTVGVRVVPVLGQVRTQTDLYTLARVERTVDGLTLVEQPCRIEIASSHGVTLNVDPAAVRALPTATTRWSDGGNGSWVATPWVSGVATPVDFDGDGRVGMPISVSAPVCSGELDVNTLTQSVANGQFDGALSGDVTVQVQRDIVRASNPCLGLLSRHALETVTGRFRFAPAPSAATCESLPRTAFPEP